MAGGPVVVLGMLLITLALNAGDNMAVPVIVLVFILFLLFFFARLFIVVEAFISIRSLPVGAYDTVNWINFLPHIG